MTTPAPRTHGIHHVAIQVRDLDAMEAFYGVVLNLPVLRRWQGEDGDRSIWFDLHDGGFLAIERVAGTPHPRDGWNTDEVGIHLVALAIKRDERDRWEARLTAAGHPIVHHTDYTLYVRDPEGNRVGLSHWPDDGNAS